MDNENHYGMLSYYPRNADVLRGVSDSNDLPVLVACSEPKGPAGIMTPWERRAAAKRIVAWDKRAIDVNAMILRHVLYDKMSCDAV